MNINTHQPEKLINNVIEKWKRKKENGEIRFNDLWYAFCNPCSANVTV